MATSPNPTCWMSGGHQHCVVTSCTPDESQAHCDAKHAAAVAALMGEFPVDP